MTALGDFSSGDVLLAADLNSIATWTTWTPTFSNVSAQPATITARYSQVNELVFWAVYFAFGGAGTITGSVNFTTPTPVVAPYSSSYFINGKGWARPGGSGTTLYEITSIAIAGVDDIYLYAPKQITGGWIQASSNVNASQPATWTSSGDAWVTGFYQA